ncbi:MAG: RNA-guided endonuclease InsQ/TnpB family protein, partial [Bacteriovoracales bacterium]
MLTRELKLKLNKKEEKILSDWLWHLASIYNFGIRKIELNATDKIYFSKFDFVNILAKHSKKLGIPSHTIQGILEQSYLAWDRCFKKKAKKPKLKSIHNKLKSIPFPDPIKFPKDNKIGLPGLGKFRYFKQEIPMGKIKKGRIIKKASGWYLQLTIDANHIFLVKETDFKVGIDTGFKTLATLSNKREIPNYRYYIQGQKRLAQAQRGKNSKLIARLHERISNRRKDHNHKESRKIIENYSEVYITNDNLKGQSKLFGKSVSDAGISQLKQFISYKCDNHGRKFGLVVSKNTTKTCFKCWSLTGPTGVKQLAVREWECSNCRFVHQR